ncbi:MAG: hypothetical protein AABX74_03655 [Nanoarchaeota archaeon]
MIKIKNTTTEGLEDILDALAELKIYPQRIILNSLFTRHDRYELVDGELVTAAHYIHPRVGNKTIPTNFSSFSFHGDFGGIGHTLEGYVIDAEFVNEPGPLQIVIAKERYSELMLSMTTPVKIDNSYPIFLSDLPQYSYGAGVRFDLSDESIRDAMRGIADRRIPVQYFAPGDNQSTVYGRKVEAGKYDVRINIELQKPDSRYLHCYVGSLFSERMEDGELKIVEHADDLPEFKFQANEGHFCDTDEDKDTYPLVPLKVDTIRILTMQLETKIGDWKEPKNPLLTITGDMPLALDKPNEFYIRGFLGRGRFFEVRRFINQDMTPEAAILYKRYFSLASAVEDLNAGMRELLSVKSHFEGVLNN